MKNSCIFSKMTLISFLLIILTQNVFSNWKFDGTSSIQNTQNTLNPKSDSLPEGVNQDWLNSLADENGNKIVPEADPEGDAFQSKVFNGLGSGYKHGTSVSSAGDVNGDGFDDIIIGAPGYSTNTGRAYIYFGGSNMNVIADVVLTGVAVNYYFGSSVSSAGDVNGDGYSDVIVGAYGYSSNAGRAYIYYGGIAMNNVVDVTMTGSAGS